GTQHWFQFLRIFEYLTEAPQKPVQANSISPLLFPCQSCERRRCTSLSLITGHVSIALWVELQFLFQFPRVALQVFDPVIQFVSLPHDLLVDLLERVIAGFPVGHHSAASLMVAFINSASTSEMRSPIQRTTGTAKLLPSALYRGPSDAGLDRKSVV